MGNLYIPQIILLGFTLIAFEGQARADVVRCIDENGAITYTNLPCERAADATRGLALNGSVAEKEKSVQFAKTFASNWEAREGVAAQYRSGKRKVSPDVDTMKTAKSSAVRLDEASSHGSKQNLVSLDLRAGWFNFR